MAQDNLREHWKHEVLLVQVRPDIPPLVRLIGG